MGFRERLGNAMGMRGREAQVQTQDEGAQGWRQAPIMIPIQKLNEMLKMGFDALIEQPSSRGLGEPAAPPPMPEPTEQIGMADKGSADEGVIPTEPQAAPQQGRMATMEDFNRAFPDRGRGARVGHYPTQQNPDVDQQGAEQNYPEKFGYREGMSDRESIANSVRGTRFFPGWRNGDHYERRFDSRYGGTPPSERERQGVIDTRARPESQQPQYDRRYGGTNGVQVQDPNYRVPLFNKDGTRKMDTMGGRQIPGIPMSETRQGTMNLPKGRPMANPTNDQLFKMDQDLLTPEQWKRRDQLQQENARMGGVPRGAYLTRNMEDARQHGHQFWGEDFSVPRRKGDGSPVTPTVSTSQSRAADRKQQDAMDLVNAKGNATRDAAETNAASRRDVEVIRGANKPPPGSAMEREQFKREEMAKAAELKRAHEDTARRENAEGKMRQSQGTILGRIVNGIIATGEKDPKRVLELALPLAQQQGIDPAATQQFLEQMRSGRAPQAAPQAPQQQTPAATPRAPAGPAPQGSGDVLKRWNGHLWKRGPNGEAIQVD
jgi:hypothetical protein